VQKQNEQNFLPEVKCTHTFAHSLALISSLWRFCLLINAENITTISSFPISIPAELTREREETHDEVFLTGVLHHVCGVCVHFVC